MKSVRLNAAVLMTSLLAVTLPCSATLMALDGGLVLDDSRHLMWIQDGSFAAINKFGVGGIGVSGQMSWSTANNWIAGMNAANYQGFTNWRLPTSLNANGTGPCFGFSCSGSEMGHLHFNNGVSMRSSLPFTNISRLEYWSSTESATNPSMAWSFSFATSLQSENFKIATTFMALPVRTFTFNDFINDAVIVTASGSTISAKFQPNFGLTLAETAALGGYDHFNWVQTVVADPYANVNFGLSTPYVDPPPGGYYNDFLSDHLPFYWDEEGDPFNPVTCTFITDRFRSCHQSPFFDPLALDFLDQPTEPKLRSGERLEFTTSLVGIPIAGGGLDVLNTFTWSSDYTGSSGRVSRTLDPNGFETGGIGGVFDVRADIPVEDLPLDVRRLLVDLGARNVPLGTVPEPSSLGLWIAGLAWLAAAQRRRGRSP